MMLTEKCPTCAKVAKIQSEVTLGKNRISVYTCGHIETVEILPPSDMAGEGGERSPDTSIYKGAIGPSASVAQPPNTESLIDQPASTGGTLAPSPASAPFAGYLHFLLTHKEKEKPAFKSIDGSKSLYQYQHEGLDFIRKSGYHCLIADAMGLGKTIQAAAAIRDNEKALLPVLVLTKSSIQFQWTRELKEWVTNKFTGVMTITDTIHLVPGFSIYVMSMDRLSRKGVIDRLLTLGIKCIILDECQSFKDSGSERTKALVRFLKLNNASLSDTSIRIKGGVEQVSNSNVKTSVIALSGTPIKNRASEYFTILNILAPSHFYSETDFKRRWLMQNEKGEYTRLMPYRENQFRELTSRWILRREKHEVLKDLPALSRRYEFITIDDPAIKKSYNYTLGLFDNFMQNTARISSTDILGWLAKLRNITGQAKCPNAVEWAQTFLEENEDSLAIGIHHKGVKDVLSVVMEAKGYKPLTLTGEDSAYAKDIIARRFNAGENRLLIMNMLAGGVGLNLQSCSNALALERCWNTADEEQFESRFHRNGQTKPVTVTYMLAEGTIDQWMHELVTKKGLDVSETLGDTERDYQSEINTATALRELADLTIGKTLK